MTTPTTLMDRLESYSFRDDHGHPLKNCEEWSKLRSFLHIQSLLDGNRPAAEKASGRALGRQDIIDCFTRAGYWLGTDQDQITRAVNAARLSIAATLPPAGKFKQGDFVRKTKGSQWKGRIVGWYSTSLTPEGYAVESSTELGSVQIYPAAALELVDEKERKQ